MSMIARRRDALRPSRRLSATKASLRAVICLVLSAAIAGCSANSPLLDQPSNEAAPNARAIIQANLETRIRDDDPESIAARESLIFPPERRISDVAVSAAQERTLTDLHGWAWRSCMRATVDGIPATLAVFVANGRVVTARTALVVDHCEQANYVPLPIKRPEPAATAKSKPAPRSKEKTRPKSAPARRND
jgi:hypothetical protein